MVAKIYRGSPQIPLYIHILEAEKYFWEIVRQYEDFDCSSGDRVGTCFRGICCLSAN